jgi:NADPH:quinone reductase-like Zn-dependent oxidoreductase
MSGSRRARPARWLCTGQDGSVKAIAAQAYGGPDVLELVELPEPKIGPDFVLVQVRAAGVNPVDWKIREGRLDGAFSVHFPLVPGWDVAGVVAKVGPSVTEFAPGDEVIGYVRRDEIQHGTYAELVPAPVRTLGPKPARASWAQAAALPLAGLTAYQALRAANTGAEDVVLVHAAAGGVGHFAVQLARLLGAARVIGTGSSANHGFIRELGAEPVSYGDGLADRVRELAPQGVDVALDLVGGDTVALSTPLMRTPDRLVSITDAVAVKKAGGRYVFVRPDTNDLTSLATFVDEGRLRVHVERTFPLAEAAEAHRLQQSGHGRGKLVLDVRAG